MHPFRRRNRFQPQRPLLTPVTTVITVGVLTFAILGDRVHANTYAIEAFKLELAPETDCVWATTAKATFRHNGGGLALVGIDKAQSALRILAEKMREDCARVSTLQLTIQGAGAPGTTTTEQQGRLRVFHRNTESAIVQRDRYWQLNQTQKAHPRSNPSRQKAVDSENAFLARTPDPRHPLADYGYYDAMKLAQTPEYDLFIGRDKEIRPSLQYVMVHNVSGTQAILPTVQRESGGSKAFFIAPSFYQNIERHLNERIQPFHARPSIVHYISKYHHPKDDRLKVLGPHYVETPLLETGIISVWEDGWKVAPYGAEIGFIQGAKQIGKNGAPLVLSVADAVTNLGPSAATHANADVPTTEVKLAAEGPSAAHRDLQSALRQRTLAKGLIFKNDAYWSSFNRPEVRRVFEGHDQYSAVGGLALPAMLMRYLTLNSEQCAATIENPVRFKLNQISRTFNQFNELIGSSQTTLFDITVPKRFEPILQRNYDTENSAASVGQGLAAAFGYMRSSLSASAQALRDDIHQIKSLQADVARLLQGKGCGDPMRLQFEEMLYHYALPQSPVKNTSMRFSHAASISDPVFQPGQATNLKTACLANSDFTQDAKFIAWCDCVGDTISRMRPDNVPDYLKRFRKFDQDMRRAETAWQRGQEHPDIPVLRSYRACAR